MNSVEHKTCDIFKFQILEKSISIGKLGGNINMAFLSTSSDFFALDIGSSAIRVVHLRGSGKNKSLVKFGEMPIATKISESESAADQKELGQAISQLITNTGISTRNVVIGIPSRNMFTTTIDLPKTSESDIAKTIKYQADKHIPMPLDEVQLDWALLGQSPKSPEQVEVLLASVSKNHAEARMELLEQIGLNVVGIEPDSVALSRALIPASGSEGATLILDVGARATDLVIATDEGPRLARGIPTGGQAFIKAAMQNLNIDEKQAQQFVYKFGLNKDKLEGQVFKSIEGTVGTLLSEVEKSVKFFATRYPNIPIDKIVVAGGASTLPELPLHIANTLGLKVEIGNAWQNVSYPNNMYNELIAVSNHFSVAVGLAAK